MFCGFVNKDYKIEIKEMSKQDVENTCASNEYFSINANDEYCIFFDKDIYREENMEHIAPLMAELNFELMKINVL